MSKSRGRARMGGGNLALSDAEIEELASRLARLLSSGEERIVEEAGVIARQILGMVQHTPDVRSVLDKHARLEDRRRRRARRSVED